MTKHLPSRIVHPLERFIVLIVVSKMLGLLECVYGYGYADLFVSIHSYWIGVVDQ
jgi:hypothetical protein